MHLERPDAGALGLTWRAAFFPAFVWLGIALPIFFLASVEQYLYYLRPAELIPTYGTAWLLLAALVVPVSLIFWFALSALHRYSTRRAYRILAIAPVAMASVATVATLAYGLMVWLRTFGLHITSQLDVESAATLLSGAALLIGLLTAIVPQARRALAKLFSVSACGSLLGALSLVSLPGSGWNTAPATTGPVTRHSAATPGSRPNILLVTIDALSAEHMSVYGSARETTPRLDAFASRAIVFDRAYANGNFTAPGIASILTGTLPWTHRSLQISSWPVSAARRESLPAILRGAGYQTGYVATSSVAGAARNGLGMYFDFSSSDRVSDFSFCRDGLATRLRYHCAASQLPPFLLIEIEQWRISQLLGLASSNRSLDPRIATQPALDWLAKADKRVPVFLWLHLLPPHAPYAAPDPWLGEFDPSQDARTAASSIAVGAFLFRRVAKERAATLEARYDESVKYVDYYTGDYLERALRLLGPNTAVIVTSDHGESFEHGYGGHGGPCLFESIIHIPLLIKLPFESQGLRTSVPVEQADIAPTVVALAGIAPPASWEGRTLLPLLQSSQAAAPLPVKPIFAMAFEENPRRSALTTGSVAAIDGRWKLVHFMGALNYPLMPPSHDELYDLAADPHELTNRISEEPAEAQRLLELVASALARHGAPLP